jgi:hypothetical protein
MHQPGSGPPSGFTITFDGCSRSTQCVHLEMLSLPPTWSLSPCTLFEKELLEDDDSKIFFHLTAWWLPAVRVHRNALFAEERILGVTGAHEQEHHAISFPDFHISATSQSLSIVLGTKSLPKEGLANGQALQQVYYRRFIRLQTVMLDRHQAPKKTQLWLVQAYHGIPSFASSSRTKNCGPPDVFSLIQLAIIPKE